MTKCFPPVFAKGGGGAMGPNIKKTTFPADFLMNATLYIRTLIFKQKKAKLPIFISRHFDFGENLKNHFYKGIFQ